MSRGLSARPRHRGFTLLELLVVLALAAITVAVVGGSAQAYMERARYHQAVRDVSSLLVQARTQSVREGKAVTVAFEPNARQLGVEGGAHVAFPESLQVVWKPIVRPPGVAPATGEALFIFSAEGSAQGGSLGILRSGQGVQFRVNWLLGTVEQAPAQAPT